MKSVLITGTNRGIGLGLVKKLLASNNVPQTIIATCRKPNEAQELQEIAKKNSNLHILQFEVDDFDSYPSLFENAKKILGNDGLNVLINNAGVGGPFLKIDELKAESMERRFKVNTIAPLMVTKQFLPLLRLSAQKNSQEPLGPSKAVIVNISSVLGSMTENTTGCSYPYRCSKAALNMATRSLSVDLKDDKILAVSIHPGWVKTDLGGPHAHLDVDTSTESLVKTITSLNESHHGSFLNYDGTTLPW